MSPPSPTAPQTVVANANPYLYEAVITPTLSSFYRNGALLYANNGGVTGPNGLAVGIYGTSEISDCWISEIIMFNYAVSPVQRQFIERYMMGKYGLSP